jgi:uroporphyrinogen-III decarboxylase
MLYLPRLFVYHCAAEKGSVDAVGLDWTIELEFARSMVQKRRPVQGNLRLAQTLHLAAPFRQDHL